MAHVHTLGKVAFVDECWDDMGALKIAGYSISPAVIRRTARRSQVIVGTENVRRYGRSKVASKLFLVRAIVQSGRALSRALHITH